MAHFPFLQIHLQSIMEVNAMDIVSQYCKIELKFGRKIQLLIMTLVER